MPLHLLGKKSWNVYNPANIARVKADEAAADAREAAEDQRRQELDAARRAAILRGQTPPPLLDEESVRVEEPAGRSDGRQRKRRKLAGEDDTDMDIRLAASATTSSKDGDSTHVKTMKLRKPNDDAPLHDPTGNINLFPIDLKEMAKREKNIEAEERKKKRERVLEDQYTMRFSNAAGRAGSLDQPWYTSQHRPSSEHKDGEMAVEKSELEGFSNKDVWGNEDPRRKQREQARIVSSDPLAFMQKAQVQLKKTKEERKKWTDERERELKELRAAQDGEDRRHRHRKRKSQVEGDDDRLSPRGHRREGQHSRHRDGHGSREKRPSHGADGHTLIPEHRSKRSYDVDRDRYVRRSPQRRKSERDRDAGMRRSRQAD
ncbi:unnamed protein product [Periconia digitata]|uniref:CBF1-interacting co-repressor CIR N-terminal domain-containing protein n=1 Tax=Periconia digitata TaxID=1303443 RepID=A0A9W4UJR6_9PLEO|nr:unnamed protein product [Periconia digitata]